MAEPLQDMFDRFAVEMTPTFRPAPLDALPAMNRRRGRHRWTALLAGLAALLVAGPAGALAVTSAGQGGFEQGSSEHFGIPGWQHFERPRLSFGGNPVVLWAFTNGLCPGTYCGSVASTRSQDLGQTWKIQPLVNESPDSEMYVSHWGIPFVRDTGITTWKLVDVGGEYLASTRVPELPGPRELLLENGGDLVLECPAGDNYGGPAALDCDAPVLASVSDLPLEPDPVPPAAMGRLTQVVKDGASRTWLLGRDAESRTYRLTFSPDDGKTWAPVAEYETTDPERARITASPVDGDVYVVTAGPSRISAVTLGPEGRAVVEPGGTEFAARHPRDVRALGGGALAGITADNHIRIVNPTGGYVEYGPDLAADTVDVLADGTVVFRSSDGGSYLIGIGEGSDRAFTTLRP